MRSVTSVTLASGLSGLGPLGFRVVAVGVVPAGSRLLAGPPLPLPVPGHYPADDQHNRQDAEDDDVKHRPDDHTTMPPGATLIG